MMVLFMIGQIIIPSGTIIAKSEAFTTSSFAETKEEKKDPDKVSKGSEDKSKDIPKEEPKNNEPPTGDSQKANDSPITIQGNPVKAIPKSELFLSEDGTETPIQAFMKENNLVQGKDGKLYLTIGEPVVSGVDINSELNKLQGKNMFSRAVNQIVVVPPWTNIGNIRVNYNNSSYEMFGWYGKRDTGGDVLWCVELSVALNLDNNGGYTTSEITTAISKELSLVAWFGYYQKGKTLRNEFMTQHVMYELMGNAPNRMVGDYSLADYTAFKNEVLAKVALFKVAPKFDKTNITLKVGESVTVTDSTGAFAEYKAAPIANSSGVTVSKSGSKVTFTATKASVDGAVRFEYNIPDSYRGATLLYSHQYTQDTIRSRIADPTRVQIPIKVIQKGSVELQKTDEVSGKGLSGANFKISYNGTSIERKSDGSGKISLPDIADDGTEITIEEITAPTGYVLNPTPKKVKIEAGKVVSVSFPNKRISGSVKLIKYADQEVGTGKPNTVLQGSEFTLIKGTDTAIAKGTSNAQGEILFTGVEYGTDYFLRETVTPIGFDPVADIPVSVTENGKTYEIKATDKIKYTSLKIAKADKETAELIAGATITYEYQGKKAQGITAADGTFTTTKIPHGAEVTVTEIKAPTGYVLNATPYKLILDSGKVNTITIENRKIRGSIKLIKKADLNWTNGALNNVLAGAEFTLFNPKGEIVDKAVSTSKGEILFSNHIYGIGYTVKETKTPIGYLPVADMKVDITEDGKVYELTATDKVVTEDAEITKVGLDSDKPILSKDAHFQVTNLQTNKLVTGTDSVTGKELNSFVVNENGTIKLPKLPYGYYELKEVKAPNGYLILTKPIKFFVDGSHNGLIKIRVGNKLAKGQVELTKTGQKVVSVETMETDYGPVYTPVYDYESLENVTFELYAKTDVITGDGVLRYEADDLVKEYTTDEQGMFKSDELYIGSYYAVEKSAPNGYIVDPTPIDFDINYEGETVPLTSTSIAAKNDWNEFEININKVDESLIGWEENEIQTENVPSNDKVFGLFKTEPFIVNEEELIPADGLVAISTTENGIAPFKGQFPEGDYYAKELNAGNDHMLSHKKYPVSIVPADNRDVLEANIFENGSFVGNANLNRMARNPIINQLFKTDVPFEKVNETAKLTKKDGYKYDYNQQGEGAEFELQNSDEEVIQTIIVDETGIGIWKDLIVGTYFMSETKTSNDSLVIDETVYRIEVTKEKVQIFNNESDVLLGEKENEETEITEKEDVEENTEDSTAETTDSTDSTELTKKTVESSTESSSNSSDEELKDQESTSSSELAENEESEGAEKEVIPLITLKNRQIRGTASIDKSDVTDATKLPDTGITIFDEDNNTVVKGRTDKEGNFTFEELPKGNYYFQEYDAPKGYILDETPIPFEVKEDGELVKSEMTNLKKVDKLAQTKARQSNMILAATIALAGLVLIGLVYTYRSLNTYDQT